MPDFHNVDPRLQSGYFNVDRTSPPLRITSHDQLRVDVYQTLTALMAQCLMFPLQHHGEMLDMIDTGLSIASFLDELHFESVEMEAWYDKHGRTQHEMALDLAAAVRTNNLPLAASIATSAVKDHPLAVMIVDETVERVQR